MSWDWGSRGGGGGRTPTVLEQLFPAGEAVVQGFNIRAWDANGLFEEVELVTPINTYGDAVVSARDFTGNGAHVVQETSGEQLIYAREPSSGDIRNLAIHTNDLTNAAYYTTGSSVIVDADSVTFAATNDLVLLDIAIAVAPTDTFTFSCEMRGIPGEVIHQRLSRAGVGTFETSFVAQTLTADWVRYKTTRTFTNAHTGIRLNLGRTTVSATVTNVDIRNIQVEPGSAETDIQIVGNAFNVSETGLEDVLSVEAGGVDEVGIAPIAGNWNDNGFAFIFAGRVIEEGVILADGATARTFDVGSGNFRVNGLTGTDLATSGVDPTEYHVVGVRCVAGAAEIWVDGTLHDSNTSNPVDQDVDAAGIGVGALTDGTGGARSKITEVFFRLNGTISNSLWSKLMDDMMKKVAILSVAFLIGISALVSFDETEYLTSWPDGGEILTEWTA